MKKHFFVGDDIIARQDVEKLERRRKMLKKIWWRILGSLPFFIILIIIIIFNKNDSFIVIIIRTIFILLSVYAALEWLKYCIKKDYEVNNGKSYY